MRHIKWQELHYMHIEHVLACSRACLPQPKTCSQETHLWGWKRIPLLRSIDRSSGQACLGEKQKHTSMALSELGSRGSSGLEGASTVGNTSAKSSEAVEGF